MHSKAPRDEREHVPNRPEWKCWGCGEEWPCDRARKELGNNLNAVDLAKFMTGRLAEAGRDLPTEPPEKLFERFIVWTWFQD